MAKRKAARSGGRKTSGGSGRGAARKAAGRKRTATRAGSARTAAKTSSKRARGGTRKAAARKATAARKTTARKTTARKTTARKATARTPARTAAARKASGRAGTARKAPASSSSAKRRPSASGTTRATPRAPQKPRAARTLTTRPAPDLNRPRRRVDEDDLVPTPPSSLDLDRSASAIRTGRRELRERYAEHTETSPALTGGDVDADWESAYSVGDEAPGGDNPTPDQDIVDDIGRAVGVEYQDNEELKGADKVAKRDKNRWELDPASSDDWDDR